MIEFVKILDLELPTVFRLNKNNMFYENLFIEIKVKFFIEIKYINHMYDNFIIF